MARCKCRYDKQSLDTKTAHKIIIDGQNTYWCSEECYNLYLASIAERDKTNAEYDEIYELTKQIFGYEFTGYSLLKKELNTWEKLATRQKIISYLKENKVWLNSVMSKEFANDYNRVRYYSAVVSSKLHDYKLEITESPKPKIVVEETIYDTSTQSTNKRRSLADLEDMF